jgi:uncharacterized coiled-coil DUF342 family protein
MINPYPPVDVNALLDKLSDAEDDASEVHSLQGSIDELESERDAHIEAIQNTLTEVENLLEDMDGDEDEYADVRQISDELERLLKEVAP